MSDRTTVQTEVYNNRFQSVVEEMGELITRSAHTVFVKETQDFGCALVTPDGEVAAASKDKGVTLMIGVPCDDAIRESKKLGIEPGDIFISNDVYQTKGMATHLPDVFVWKPIFYEGEILAYAWEFLHSSDIGGIVPGSIAPSSSEIYQEGLRIPVSKLYSAGELNQQILNIIRSNSRIPDRNWGDIMAMISGLNTAERRIKSLAERDGADTVASAMTELMEYAENQAREEFEKIPDGEYEYTDYLEAEHVDRNPVRLKLTMKVDGSDITLDFTGTDPQTDVSFNLPSHERRGHSLFTFTIISYLKTVRSDLTYNSGLVRPVGLSIPSGTVLNPEPGAACGNRTATLIRLCDMVLGVFSKACPEDVPAAGAGQAAIMLIRVPDFETGGDTVSVIQPLCGGSGGRPDRDGIDGMQFAVGFLKNIPIESIENDVDVVFNHYRLRQDSGGAGRHRGGNGVEIEFRLLAPEATITSRSMDRHVFAPWGRDGGNPGHSASTVLNPGTPDEDPIGKIDVLDIEHGDILSIKTPGGGGLGDPLDRPPEDVVADVNSGFVSERKAEAEYGVVMADGDSHDPAATERRRDELRNDREPRESIYDFGDARDEYESIWSDSLVNELNAEVRAFPIRYQPTLRQRICDRIEEAIEAGSVPTADDVEELVAEETKDLRL